MPEIRKAEGAYAVPRLENKTLLMTIPDEDLGKYEGVFQGSETVLLPIIPGMFGILTEKMDEGESSDRALARGWWEERGFIRSHTDFPNSLPQVEIVQRRAEGLRQITAHGHTLSVTPEEMRGLSEVQVKVVEDTQLLYFLQTEGSRILRPAVHAILKLFIQHLEKGETISL